MEATGRLPNRSDLEPDDLTPRALPYVMLVDIDPDLEKLRWRLMGTAHVAFNRGDLTGRLLASAYPEGSSNFNYVKSLYATLLKERRPLWSVNEIAHSLPQFRIKISRLMLPLSSDGNAIDLCVAIQISQYPTGDQKDPPFLWHGAHYAGELERRVL